MNDIKVFEIKPRSITTADVCEAIKNNFRLVLSDEARKKSGDCREYLDEKIKSCK